MFFRNLRLYRLPAGWDIDAEALEKMLAAKPLAPCGSMDMVSRGWVFPREEGLSLIHISEPTRPY
jgi:recombination associated protein RdgC